MIEPRLFQNIPMIKISHTKVARELGLPEGVKYAKFQDFFTPNGDYKLTAEVSKWARKKPLEKNKYDNELIKIDERLISPIWYIPGSLLRIISQFPRSPNNKWVKSHKPALGKVSKKEDWGGTLFRNQDGPYFPGFSKGGLEEEGGSQDWDIWGTSRVKTGLIRILDLGLISN